MLLRGRVLGWTLGAGIWVLAGCGFFVSEPDRQWYKPEGRYTAEEFKRDKSSCTVSGKVDVACMKAKGWFYFTADVPPEVSPKPEPGRPPLPGQRY